MNFNLLITLILIGLMVVIRFSPTDQFQFPLTGALKLLGRSQQALLILSPPFKFDMEKEQKYLEIESELEGLDEWDQITKNYNFINYKRNNNDHLRLIFVSLVTSFHSTTNSLYMLPLYTAYDKIFTERTDPKIVDLLKINPKAKLIKTFIEEYYEELTNNLIPDCIVFSFNENNFSMEDLNVTINFFLKYKFYRQLIYLISCQQREKNPITAKFFKNTSIKKLERIFDYMLMMSEDLVDNFFESSSSSKSDVLFMIAPLIASKAGISNKIFQVIERFVESPEINKKDLLKYIGIGFLSSKDNLGHNHDQIYRKKYFHLRNEKIIDNLSLVSDLLSGESDVPDISIGLKALRILNEIDFDADINSNVLENVCKNESGDSILLILEFLKMIISEYDEHIHLLYSEFISRFELLVEN